MTLIKQVSGKYIVLEIRIQTRDVITHSIVTRYSKEFNDILEQTTSYMRNLIRSFEDEKREELTRVGK